MFTTRSIARLTCSAAALAFAASLAPAQVLFLEDFETGIDNWTATGYWNAESSTDTCGSMAPAWPVGQGGAYYGRANCDYAGDELFGDLILNSPITIPDTQLGVSLSFWGYDDTECDSCGWDWRFIYVSTDNGANWDFIGESQATQLVDAWHESRFDLSDYRGEDILLRFEFDAVDSVSNQFLGWLIDEVRVVLECPAPTNYCIGFTNSTGNQARISVSGSTSIATDDFRLSVTGAPPGEMGIFFFGSAEANVPFGTGRLCVAGGSTGTVRIRPALQVGGAGNLTRQIPLSVGPYAPSISAGENRYFQFWYRDPAGGGFNFSDGVRVFFCP